MPRFYGFYGLSANLSARCAGVASADQASKRRLATGRVATTLFGILQQPGPLLECRARSMPPASSRGVLLELVEHAGPFAPSLVD